jgi:hypothetical protein
MGLRKDGGAVGWCGLTACSSGSMMAVNHVSSRVCRLSIHGWATGQLPAVRWVQGFLETFEDSEA